VQHTTFALCPSLITPAFRADFFRTGTLAVTLSVPFSFAFDHPWQIDYTLTGGSYRLTLN